MSVNPPCCEFRGHLVFPNHVDATTKFGFSAGQHPMPQEMFNEQVDKMAIGIKATYAKFAPKIDPDFDK